jgi:hypothetical protein
MVHTFTTQGRPPLRRKLGAATVLAMLTVVACSTKRVSNSTAASHSVPVATEVSFPASLATSSFTQSQFNQHIAELKKKIPSRDFSIVVQPPFVVIGDEPRDVVKQHAEETIRWAVEKLKQDYFADDPAEILDIWLFKDATSYRKHAKLIFNDNPSTPYGYYSRAHKALIMNISTGGGTLVHEIVHPFVEANFADCPSWFNEGLGSLYEQCAEQDGHIHGYVNWRLQGLQQAIKDGRVRPFDELTSMDTNTFYSDTRGVNYAQSRYLLYYLQEKGLLVDFYRLFHSQRKNDPTGYKSLVKILGNPDMERFQKSWQKYVLGLNEDFRLQVTN